MIIYLLFQIIFERPGKRKVSAANYQVRLQSNIYYINSSVIILDYSTSLDQFWI